MPTWLLSTHKKGLFKAVFENRYVKKEGINPFIGLGGIRLVQNQENTTTDYNSVFILCVKEKDIQTTEDKTNIVNKKEKSEQGS